MAIYLTSKEFANLPLITEGGEAKIYSYGNGTSAIKIYKPHVNISRKEQKVKRFIKANFPSKILAPKDEVLIDNQFRGNLMVWGEDTEIIHQLIKPKYLKLNRISNEDVLRMMVELGRTLQFLHKNRIIIGDISDYNILMKDKNLYFIDVDSWGLIGEFTPDAYTEIFTDPKAYDSNGYINFSLESEYYSFAVLSFNMLSRIHPFNGTYEKDTGMSTLNRMKRKISVLGNHQIIIPKMIPSWKWMSPDLQKAYLEIFEQDKRYDITDILQEQLNNSKYCKIHEMYYYSKYSECPLCCGSAKVNVIPTIVRVQTNNGPKLLVVFENKDLHVLMNENHYISINNEMVHIPTNKRVKFQIRKNMCFSEDGNFLFVITNDKIEVYRTSDFGNSVGDISKTRATFSFERMYKTQYEIKGNDLYYVDKSGYLVKITFKEKGNIKKNIQIVYNPRFEISDDGEVFVVSLYPKKAVVTVKHRNYTFEYAGKIGDYAIKYDEITKKWLFVYLKNDGKYRTLIFGDKAIEYDNDTIQYNAMPLSGICFYNNTIYNPSDEKIIGTNYLKNQGKAFDCNVVNENSTLKFNGRKFIIVGKDKIYTFGA